MAGEMLIATNPDPDSRLPYLLRIPLGAGLVFRTAGTWPRTKALYCYPLDVGYWPDEPEIVERVAVRSCVRRGAAIELVLERGRENRSQLVYTKVRAWARSVGIPVPARGRLPAEVRQAWYTAHGEPHQS